MTQKSKTFRFKFNNKEGYHPAMRPGQYANIYGHQFVMQEDGTMVCTETVPEAEAPAHTKMLQAEVAARRITMLRDEETAIESSLKIFSDNVNEFYGMGDLETLKKKLMALSPTSMIVRFAQDRGITIPTEATTKTAKVNEIIDRIRAMVG